MKEVFIIYLWSDFYVWLIGGWYFERDDGGMLGLRFGGAFDRGVRGGTGLRYDRFMGIG